MRLDEAIRGRRSVARVRQDPVSRDAVERLLDAATWAPNHKLTEPWRFVVIAGAARDELGAAHAAAVARVNPGLTPEARDAQLALTARAPVIIACICVSPGDDDVVRREDRDAVAAAVQNLLLAAHAEGLGAIWRTGAFVDEPEVRDHVGCGDDDAIVGFVYLGYPDGAPPEAPGRRPAAAVTRWRGWADAPAS